MEEIVIKHRPRRQSPVQKHRSQQGVGLACLLVSVILLITLFGLIAKDRAFSENENRNLAQKPELSWSALQSGTYLSNLSTYYADQFPGRDSWLSIQLWLNQMLGSREAGGVYLCKDHYLMQVPGEANEEHLEKNLKEMDAFAKANPDVNMVASIIPNAVTIHADKLPKNAPVRDQRADLARIDEALEQVGFVDVTEKLCTYSQEQLFYRTDHHWTSLAAAYAFEEIAPALGLQAPPLSSYTRYTVSATFEGTLSSKSGSHKARDKVELFVPKTEVEYFVQRPDSEAVCTMYHREALSAKDHYTVFFGGNYPRIDISTTAETGKNLLVFKDSYANCFVQFLYPYFENITIIDPRYYYDTVDTIMNSGGITDVLFLYNLDTFLSDTSLADAL